MANEGIMALPQGQQMQGKGPDMDALNKAAPRAGAYKDLGKTLQELDPQMTAQYKSAIAPVLRQMQLTPEQIRMMIQLFDYLSEHRDEYPQLLAELVQKGVLQQGDLPEQFDATLMAVLQLVLHELQDQAPSQDEQGIGALPQGQGQSERPPFAMKKGGLVQAARRLQSQGRNGDTILAHINPREAAMLKAMGGSGTINPATGLREYGFFSSIWKGITGAVSSVVSAVKQAVASPIGKILATVALTYFLGPAGAGFFSSTSVAAGVASAGLTAVSGGSMADVVKSGLMAYGGSEAFQAFSPPAAANPATNGFSGNPNMSTEVPDGGTPSSPSVAGISAPPPPTPIQGVTAINAENVTANAPIDPNSFKGYGMPEGAQGLTATPAGSAAAAPAQGAVDPNSFKGYGMPEGAQGLTATPAGNAAPAGPTSNAPIGSTGTKGIGDLATNASDMLFGKTPTPAEISAEAGKLRLANPGLSMDKALDMATKSLTPSTLRSVAPAAILAGAALSKTSLTETSPVDRNPLGLSNQTSDDYMKRPEFKNYKGWDISPTPPTPPITTQVAGPTPMNPTQNSSPYTMPTPGQAPRNMVNQPYNQPYRTAGLYDLYGQPTQQMNMGGPVNNAHVSGSGMQQSMTNAFSGGGGIGALSPSSFAQGGNTHYPRRTGPIDGPGTGTSDSIPAMLSDGEFVFTAKAVKKAGNGSRREGAKRMYQLMHMLEHGGKV